MPVSARVAAIVVIVVVASVIGEFLAGPGIPDEGGQAVRVQVTTGTLRNRVHLILPERVSILSTVGPAVVRHFQQLIPFVRDAAQVDRLRGGPGAVAGGNLLPEARGRLHGLASACRVR